MSPPGQNRTRRAIKTPTLPLGLAESPAVANEEGAAPHCAGVSGGGAIRWLIAA
jgi:hypothetical protein